MGNDFGWFEEVERNPCCSLFLFSLFCISSLFSFLLLSTTPSHALVSPLSLAAFTLHGTRSRLVSLPLTLAFSLRSSHSLFLFSQQSIWLLYASFT